MRPRSSGAKDSRQKSAITNSNGEALAGVDGRSAESRRFKDLYHQYLRQAGGRNPELCRQLAALVMRRELLDAQMVKGEPVDPLALVRLSNAISRTFNALGLVRPKAAAPPIPIRERLAGGAHG